MFEQYSCLRCGCVYSTKERQESVFCQNCGTYLTRKTQTRETVVHTVDEGANVHPVEYTLANTYKLIQRALPSAKIDSLEVVKRVEKYRQYWRPRKANVILLAESHVYTDEEDSRMQLNKSIMSNILPDYPLHFVRFVYCLGYGETELLTRKKAGWKNTGTPQYWKIFSACIAEDENNRGFHKILKTETKSFFVRLHNKVRILQTMKSKGIWLLDASIVGLYGSGQKDARIFQEVLEICWNYMKDTILEASPKHVIVIGKGAGDILYRRLHGLSIPFTVIPQPQARGTSEWQLENYKRYQRICVKSLQ